MGGHLRATLSQGRVILVNRKEPKLRANEQWRFVDLAEPIKPELLTSGKVLCHLAYSMTAGRQNVAYNRSLLGAVNACPSIEQVVLMSSTSVYGASDLAVVDEQSPCDPVGEYAETKLACEMVWRQGLREDCALTVLRPSEIVGPGGEGLQLLVRDAIHRPFLGVVKRSVLYHRPLHYVAVSNVVAAVHFCLRNGRNAVQEIYIISDDHQPENKSYAAMQDAVRLVSGRRPLPGVAMPRFMLRGLGRLKGRPLSMVQTFSSRKIHAVGFNDAKSLRDEVRCLVHSLEQIA